MIERGASDGLVRRPRRRPGGHGIKSAFIESIRRFSRRRTVEKEEQAAMGDGDQEPPATPVAPLPKKGPTLAVSTVIGLILLGIAVVWIMAGDDRSEKLIRFGYVFLIASVIVLIYGAVV